MPHKIRFAAALLILFALTCGSLSAFPLGPPAISAGRGMDTLTVLVERIASLFSWERPQGKVPKHPRSKIAAQIDPDGHS